MNSALPLGVCLLLAASARAAGPRAKTFKQSPTGIGTVIELTANRLYLDRGKADGLELGATLVLTRRGDDVGTCLVTELSDHRAVCSGTAKRGDQFRLPPKPKGEREPEAPSLAVASPEELARRREVLERVAFPMVDSGVSTSVKARTSSRGLRGMARLSHQSWVSNAVDRTNFHGETVQVTLRDAAIGAGFSASVDAMAVQWTGRPSGILDPAPASELRVYQAQIDWRSAQSPWSLAAGRVWAAHAPFVPSYDGVEVGFRPRLGATEMGVIAGFLPDPLRLVPGLNRPLLGAYLSQNMGVGTWRVGHETQANLFSTPELGPRLVISSEGRAWLGGATDLTATVRIGAGQRLSVGFLEAARFEASTAPIWSVRLWAGGRYQSLPPAEVVSFGDALTGVRSVRADAGASWDITPSFRLDASGIVASDLDSGLLRLIGGLDLSGYIGAKTLRWGAGYQRAVGWTSGHTAYVRGSWLLAGFVDVGGQLGYLQDRWISQGVVQDSRNELTAVGTVGLRVASWLSLEAAIRASGGMDSSITFAPIALNGQVSLVLRPR